MPHEPIPYDSSYAALVKPESRPPLADFSADWEDLDAICAELSRLAYIRFDEGHEAELAAALSKAGFTRPKCFDGRYVDEGEDKGAEAFGTTIGGRAAFVVFRGTQGDKWRDIVADIRFLPCEWDGPGKVHRGFWQAYSSLRGAIADWVGAQSEPSLVITGHSLGAAMATLMAAHHPSADLVTFGSPRVGTGPFADPFAGRNARRYVDCADLVAQVPPEGVLDCTHIDGETYIDGAGRLHRPQPDAAAKTGDQKAALGDYFRRIGWKFLKHVPSRRGADHAPINYVSAVLGRRTGP